MPFAEQVPFAGTFAPLAALLPHAQEFGAGSDTPPLRLGGWRIATPICSESAEPAFVRSMVLPRTELLNPIRMCWTTTTAGSAAGLFEQMVEIANYLNAPKVVTKELIDQACAAYFVDL